MTLTPERDDAALAASALAGDQRAFTELMRRHKDGLYRFVRGYVGDASEAYDVVQESFVAAWTALPRFDRARPFGAWLKRIALNKCRDWGRRRRVRRFFYTAQDIDAADSHVSNMDVTTPEHRDDRLARLDAAIAALPDSLKAPLLLILVEGMSHKDAGLALGLSAKAVEVRVYRAKRKLAAALGNPNLTTLTADP